MRNMTEMLDWLEEHGILTAVYANDKLVKIRREETGYLGVLPVYSDMKIVCSFDRTMPYVILPVQQHRGKDGLMFYTIIPFEDDQATFSHQFRLGSARFAKWPHNQMQFLIRGNSNKFFLVQVAVIFRNVQEKDGVLVYNGTTRPRAYLRAQILFEGEVHKDSEGKLVVHGPNFHVRDTLYGCDENGNVDIIEKLFKGLPDFPKSDITRQEQLEGHANLHLEQGSAEQQSDTTPGIGEVLWSIHSYGVAQVLMEDGRRVKIHYSKAIIDKHQFWAPMPGDIVEIHEIDNSTTHGAGRSKGMVRLEAISWTDEQTPS